MSPVLKGKHAFLEMLRAEGVEYIFGNPGTSESPFMDVLDQYPELKYRLVVQEGVAIGMAEGYGRASGKVPFVSLHIDSGLGNAFSLLIDSYKAGSPMVITAGNKDVRKLAEGRTDLVELARPFVKWSAEITHAEQYPSVIRRAFNEARTTPTGPVFISLAGNTFDAEAEMDITPSRVLTVDPTPDPDVIARIGAALASANAPVMVVGDRVSQYGAVREAARVAERTGARVYSHNAADLNFPLSHPQFRRGLSLRQPAARQALRSADVVLAVGCPVFTDFFHNPGRALPSTTKLIHIDMQAAEIGKSEPTDIGMFAQPKTALDALDRDLAARMTGSQVEASRVRSRLLAEEARKEREAFESAANAANSRRPMGPAALAMELWRAWPRDAVLVDDSISTRGALHQAFQLMDPGSMYGGSGGAIGWGMGLALGVKLAKPDRPVIAVVGDGTAMMTVQALWTAASYQIPVVYVVCNNASYRILKVNMEVYRRMAASPSAAGKYHHSFDFNVPFDMAAISRAFGVAAVRIEDPAKFGPELKKAVESGKPALMDVAIDGAV